MVRIGKSEFGRRATYLGLEGDFPRTSNNFRLSANLTPEKAKNWTNQIGTFLKDGAISTHRKAWALPDKPVRKIR